MKRAPSLLLRMKDATRDVLIASKMKHNKGEDPISSKTWHDEREIPLSHWNGKCTKRGESPCYHIKMNMIQQGGKEIHLSHQNGRTQQGTFPPCHIKMDTTWQDRSSCYIEIVGHNMTRRNWFFSLLCQNGIWNVNWSQWVQCFPEVYNQLVKVLL